MRKTFPDRALFIAIFISAFLASNQVGCKRVSEKPPASLVAAIDSVRQIYSPDRRLSVFDTRITMLGKNITITGEVDQPKALAALTSAAKSATKDYKVEVEVNLLPDAALNGKTFGMINSSVANLRSKPAYSAELASQLLLGTEVRILKKQGAWFYVQAEDGYLGWLNSVFFIWGDQRMEQQWYEKPLMVFTDLKGKVYEMPASRSAIVSDLVGGGILQKVGARKGWVQVRLPDGRQGFVQSRFLVGYEKWQKRFPKNGQQIVQTALKFHGLPYLWGGTSPNAFDCSGFTQTVFKWNGIQLLRDASQQYRQGVPISSGKNFENLQPGDLLFFGPNPKKIVHVGIYIGNKRFIHSSGRVKITSLDPAAKDFSEYRYKTFVGARRMLNTQS